VDQHAPIGLSSRLGDLHASAIESSLTRIMFSPARPRRHERLLRRSGIPPTWASWAATPSLYAMLDVISRSREPGPTSLADRLGLHISTVSRQVASLEDRGLVRAQRHHFRRRETVISLTVRGHDAARQLRDVRRHHVLGLLEGWSEDDKNELARLLYRLASGFRSFRGRGRDL
jgi:DNA-binding MarR family transcriptional regulator